MNIVVATQGYEEWLAGLVPLHRTDIDYKHECMAHPSDPFPFFRGTYYLWLRRWAEAAGPLADAPMVLAVGDLHMENYGTWRDADGRLCWGVNDFDEADHLPYAQDLVRLAASVRLARRAAAVSVPTERASALLVAGYRRSLEAGGVPFVLEERHRRLRALAMSADREPLKFWRKETAVLDEPPAEPPEEARQALLEELPDDALRVQFRLRARAGQGSLGKPRYLALARWRGSWVAREAKALTPPATAWAASESGRISLAAEAAGRAVRCPDPSYKLRDGWVLRRRAPRCSRIELTQLKGLRDPARLLRAMGAEAANVHLGTPGCAAAILADLDRRPEGWLAEAARAFCRLVRRDWRAWREARG